MNVMRTVALALLVVLAGSLPVKCVAGCVDKAAAPADEHRCCAQPASAGSSAAVLAASATMGDCCSMLDGDVTAPAKALLAPALLPAAVALFAPQTLAVPIAERPAPATASPPLVLRI